MKKRFFAALGIFIILAAVLYGCTTSSYSGIGVSKTFLSNRWSISAGTINGHFSKTINFSAAQMTSLHVKSANSDGKVTLTFTQGDTVKTFDVSGTYDGNIDMSAYTAGKISMRLDLESVKDVDVTINWQPR